jgi:hypothetical protein
VSCDLLFPLSLAACPVANGSARTAMGPGVGLALEVS